MSLVVDNIVKRFDHDAAPILDGVSFTVAPRSITCLLGASGVGKSTVLNILAGLISAESGTVQLGGDSLDGLPAHRRPFTLLMQQPQLFAHLDVRENVAFGLRVRGVDRHTRRARAVEMLELVGVAHLARRSTGNLSGGEQQRVALARALAVQPAVLLADEPFASVDASVRRDLQNLVTTVHRELGTTMLMVTHDLEEARKVADHWVVLEQGRVVAIGPPCDVIHRPTTEAMAQLFGLNTPAAKIIECSGRIDVRISASNVGQGGIVAGLRQVGTMIEVTVVDRECTFVTHVEPDRCPSIGDRLLIEGCAGQLELAGHPAR